MEYTGIPGDGTEPVTLWRTRRDEAINAHIKHPTRAPPDLNMGPYQMERPLAQRATPRARPPRNRNTPTLPEESTNDK